MLKGGAEPEARRKKGHPSNPELQSIAGQPKVSPSDGSRRHPFLRTAGRESNRVQEARLDTPSGRLGQALACPNALDNADERRIQGAWRRMRTRAKALKAVRPDTRPWRSTRTRYSEGRVSEAQPEGQLVNGPLS